MNPDPKSTTPPRRPRYVRFLTALTAFAVLGFVALQVTPPSWILAGLYGTYAWRSGVQVTGIDIAESPLLAYEGGPEPSDEKIPLLLLHGFGDSMISFVQTARWLTPRHHVLLPQLPGFGESPDNPDLSYSIRSQVERVHALLDKKGWQKAHLVGNSMGGHISAAFALRYPERVGKLVLLSPAGLRVDDPIPYRPQEKPISTPEAYDAFMGQLFYKRPWVPEPFKKDFMAKSAERFEWLAHVRQEIREGEDYILNDRIPEIKAPTLIIWGRHDGVVRVAHAPVWHQSISGSKLILQEDSGHSPQYEYPERTARQILEFLGESR